MDIDIWKREIKIINKQCFPFNKVSIIDAIIKSSSDDLKYAIYQIYCYGVMEDKREERAKRKLDK